MVWSCEKDGRGETTKERGQKEFRETQEVVVVWSSWIHEGAKCSREPTEG